ncbi:hypothetical protein SAMN04488103_10120 [Gemmobacter aquatilis]|uniref:Uncharacterized protein n=1 Tax=Gemmobacter aquatilis TaxID=933059 RepID=A0A1H7XZT7_9RHOB|nr:hypothetical protein [Gemmobacter aquatilis]SEM39476.1 hypothetical protein SAMN04488103_10120 [Gemmobacter aquatilis]
MTASSALRHPAAIRAGTMTVPQGTPRVCAVRLIDRRTGTTHRINGAPLTIFTRRPDEAIAELMEGRDPTVWEARVEVIEKEVRR